LIWARRPPGSGSRASRETALRQMNSEEIRHIARTCGSATGSAYYARFAEQTAFRELIAPIAEDLERVWQEGKRKKEEES